MTQIRLMLACLVLLVAASAAAQTQLPSPLPSTCKVQWDHSGIDVQRWEVRVDGSVWTSAPAPTQSGTVWTVTPCPTLSVGAHTLVVAACNVSGCNVSSPFSFRLVVVPLAPTNARMGDSQ